jgi:hypothetical protein
VPLAQPRHGLRELHLVIEFRKANHVPATATAVAVEKVLLASTRKLGGGLHAKGTAPSIGRD